MNTEDWADPECAGMPEDIENAENDTEELDETDSDED
jgi:hypothetical protein